MTDENRAAFDRLAARYAGELLLHPPEQLLVASLEGKWPTIDMLDLGIGYGRTSLTFARLARTYVGIDYAPQMIAIAREVVAPRAGIRIEEGDARDLSAFAPGPFQLVLFSYNGIDSVSYEDRALVFAEVRRVLDSDGLFVFSSQTLSTLPLRGRRFRAASRSPARIMMATGRTLHDHLVARRANRRIGVGAIKRRGWGVVRDPRSETGVAICRIDPARQVSDLEAAGFSVVATYGPDAEPVDPAGGDVPFWIHYWCRPATPREHPG